MLCRFSAEAERRELTPIDNLFITEYLPEASGQDVCVYIYGLMQCYYPSMRDITIAQALSITHAQVLCSFVYWQSKGLVRIVCQEPLTVEYINATVQEATVATPSKYSELIRSLNSLVEPRLLQLRELKYVYDFIEQYGLDEGAVLELFGYCIQTKGKRVSINYINTVALSWSERGIKTSEQAQTEIAEYLDSKHGATEILRRWSKRRKPTVDEMQLYDKWKTQWGFDQEAILSACPRLVSVGTPTFAALNDELEALYRNNLTDSKAIEKSDQWHEADREFAIKLFSHLGKVEPPSRTNIAQIGVFLNDKQLPKQVILLAADACVGVERPFGYLKTILKDWCNRGINTVEAAESALLERQRQRPQAKATFNKQDTFNYSNQRQLSNSDVADRFVNLDEDF